MYKFKNLDQVTPREDLPSYAMIYNGRHLEDLIPGYRTLNVTGRETISDNLDTLSNIPDRDGALVLGRTLPTRNIGIEYRLTAMDAGALQESFRQLRAALDVPGQIGFLDDPGIIYHGQLSAMGNVLPYTNDLVGAFTLYCADPYKYAATPVVKTGNPVAIYHGGPYPVQPEEIKITLAATTSGITVTNNTTGKKIILTGSYTSGNIIRISPAAEEQAQRITKNGASATASLDYLASDFGEFLIHDGDSIKVTPATAAMTITTRARWK